MEQKNVASSAPNLDLVNDDLAQEQQQLAGPNANSAPNLANVKVDEKVNEATHAVLPVTRQEVAANPNIRPVRAFRDAVPAAVAATGDNSAGLVK